MVIKTKTKSTKKKREEAIFNYLYFCINDELRRAHKSVQASQVNNTGWHIVMDKILSNLIIYVECSASGSN